MVSGKAIRELGNELVIALHVDQAPVNFTKDARKAKPHFNILVRDDAIYFEANLRG